MQDNETKNETSIGEMRKKRETMADGRRYIIYYAFEKSAETSGKLSNDMKLRTSTLKDRMSSPMFKIPDDTKSKTEDPENV